MTPALYEEYYYLDDVDSVASVGVLAALMAVAGVGTAADEDADGDAMALFFASALAAAAASSVRSSRYCTQRSVRVCEHERRDRQTQSGESEM
jgi:hypothetical protein